MQECNGAVEFVLKSFRPLDSNSNNVPHVSLSKQGFVLDSGYSSDLVNIIKSLHDMYCIDLNPIDFPNHGE